MINREMIHKILFVVSMIFSFTIPFSVLASNVDGTIQIPDQYAWGENVGWINFAADNGNIHVTDSGLTGYMWDSVYGWVNLSPTGSGVINDGSGNLSGKAWSQGAGFIDFAGVIINSSGKFTGQAEGDTYGRINFDCSTCNVTTDWRAASQRTSPNVGVGSAVAIAPSIFSRVTSAVERLITYIPSVLTPVETISNNKTNVAEDAETPAKAEILPVNNQQKTEIKTPSVSNIVSKSELPKTINIQSRTTIIEIIKNTYDNSVIKAKIIVNNVQKSPVLKSIHDFGLRSWTWIMQLFAWIFFIK